MLPGKSLGLIGTGGVLEVSNRDRGRSPNDQRFVVVSGKAGGEFGGVDKVKNGSLRIAVKIKNWRAWKVRGSARINDVPSPPPTFSSSLPVQPDARVQVKSQCYSCSIHNLEECGLQMNTRFK